MNPNRVALAWQLLFDVAEDVGADVIDSRRRGDEVVQTPAQEILEAALPGCAERGLTEEEVRTVYGMTVAQLLEALPMAD